MSSDVKFLPGPVGLAYRWTGRADGPVLVLSHWLGGTGSMWELQLARWEGEFRILIYDQRGHGKSGCPDGPWRIDDFGHDLIALLDAESVGHAHFCGLSLGGMVGLWLAAHAPERIDRLVVCNTAARLEDTRLLRSRIDQIQHNGLPSITDSVLERWFTPSFRDQHPAVVQASRNQLLLTSPAGYAATSEALCAMNLLPVLERNTAPTLVIAGRDDVATPPAWSETIVASMRDARLITLAAAHLSCIEAAEAFGDAVVEFLCS